MQRPESWRIESHLDNAGAFGLALLLRLRELTGQTGLAGRAWNVLTDPEASMWDKTATVGKLPFKAIDKFVRTEQMDTSGRRNAGVLTADDMARWQAAATAAKIPKE